MLRRSNHITWGVERVVGALEGEHPFVHAGGGSGAVTNSTTPYCGSSGQGKMGSWGLGEAIQGQGEVGVARAAKM